MTEKLCEFLHCVKYSRDIEAQQGQNSGQKPNSIQRPTLKDISVCLDNRRGCEKGSKDEVKNITALCSRNFQNVKLRLDFVES